MSDDRPGWARRIVAERKARGWSQSAAIAALRGHSPEELPADESLIREWKQWEAGETMPQRYRPLIAALFGTIEHRQPEKTPPAALSSCYVISPVILS